MFLSLNSCKTSSTYGWKGLQCMYRKRSQCGGFIYDTFWTIFSTHIWNENVYVFRNKKIWSYLFHILNIIHVLKIPVVSQHLNLLTYTAKWSRRYVAFLLARHQCCAFMNYLVWVIMSDIITQFLLL